MTRKPLKVAVVGASLSSDPSAHQRFAVDVHLPVLKALSGLYEVVATCTTRMETAAAAAQRFAVPHAFDGVERMLKELPEIDVVCVSVRPVAQHAVVTAALRAGKHVYCEHPFGRTVEQAQDMHQLASRAGVRTVVGHEHHYEPAMLHLAELVKQGYLGKPLTFNIIFFNSGNIAPQPRRWTLQSEMGGPPAWRTGHSLERVTSVLGDVTRICADIAALPTDGSARSSDQVNNVNFLMRVGDHVMGTLQLSLSAWFGTGWDFQVYGTEGMLMMRARESIRSAQDGAAPGGVKLHGARINRGVSTAGPGAVGAQRGKIEEIAVPARHSHIEGFDRGSVDFLVAQMWHALAIAIDTETECVPNFRDELKIHCVWEAAERSMRDLKWAEVDYGRVG